MGKKVVLVGHCGADSSYLKLMVRQIDPDAQVVSAHSTAELKQLLDQGTDLVLLNRQVDYGFSSYEGVDIIREFKQSHPNAKLMMITNYPDAQEAAVEAGGIPGFGKRELGSQRVKDLLKHALETPVSSA
jgi:two-component system, chemotaxis family, chemotaxis protein CheY